MVANPVVPTALEHLVDKKSLSKKEKKDAQPTPTVQGFNFGNPQPTPGIFGLGGGTRIGVAPAGLFGTTVPGGF